MPEYLSSEGGPPVSDGNVPSQEDIERRERGARAIGYDPVKGWPSGIPSAPGYRDAAIFAEHRAQDRMLNPQQFDAEGPMARTWEWPENQKESADDQEPDGDADDADSAEADSERM
jgi:hypothetical protein